MGDLRGVSADVIKEARRRVLECAACAHGKATRAAFGNGGVDKGQAPGEVPHMDTYYVQHGDGDGRKEYGLVVVDPYSEYMWFALLRTKDEGAARVIDIVRNAQTQCGRAVKRLYADGGTEFINATLKDSAPRRVSSCTTHLRAPRSSTLWLNAPCAPARRLRAHWSITRSCRSSFGQRLRRTQRTCATAASLARPRV